MRLLFHSAPLPPERPLSCLARFGLLIAPYKRSKRRLSDTIRTMEWPPLIPFEIHPVKRALAEIKKAFEFKKAGDMNRFDSWHSYSLLEINRLSAEHGEQLLEGLARQGLTVVYQPLTGAPSRTSARASLGSTRMYTSTTALLSSTLR